jgi:hypothetical protein
MENRYRLRGKFTELLRSVVGGKADNCLSIAGLSPTSASHRSFCMSSCSTFWDDQMGLEQSMVSQE